MIESINDYDSNADSKNTLQMMISNFANGYDLDPTEDQISIFEKCRKENIIQNYTKSLELRKIEDKTREFISSDPDIRKAVNLMKNCYLGYSKESESVLDSERPISVAKIISRNFLDKEMILSGLSYVLVNDVPSRKRFMDDYSDNIYSIANFLEIQGKPLRKITYFSDIDLYDYKTLIISLSETIQNIRDMINLLEIHGKDSGSISYEQFIEKKQQLLLYSIKIRPQVEKFNDEKFYTKLTDMYNELCTLIGYFLEQLG